MACRRWTCTLHRGPVAALHSVPLEATPRKTPQGAKNNWIPVVLDQPQWLPLPPSWPLEIVLSRSDLAFGRSGSLTLRLAVTIRSGRGPWMIKGDSMDAQSSTVHEAAESMLQGACPASSSNSLGVMCDGWKRYKTPRCVGVLRTGKGAPLGSSGAAWDRPSSFTQTLLTHP